MRLVFHLLGPCFAAGIAVATRFPIKDVPLPLVAAGWLWLLAAWRWTAHRPGPRVTLLLFLVVLAGLVRFAWWQTDLPGTLAAGATTIRGRVAEVEAGSFSTRLVVAVESPGRGRVRVTLSGSGQTGVSPGDVVAVSGTLVPLAGPTNPGQSDPRLHWHAAGVFWDLSGRLVAVEPGHHAWASIRSLLQRALERSLPREDSDLLRALLFGDKSRLPRELRESAALAGISHLFAVSGLHASVVGLAGAYLAAKAGLGRLACLAGLAAVCLYAAVCGPGPAIIRAMVMYAVGVTAHLFCRQIDTVVSLNIAALVVLWFWPPWLFTAGFQLSFMAVAGIALLGPVIRAYLGFIPRPLAASLATTTSVQLATLPILGWHFGQVSLAGLLVNIVAVPAALVAVVAGLVTAIVSLVSFTLGGVCGIVVRLALLVLGICARAGSRLPGAAISLPAFGAAATAWYYLVLGACLNRRAHRRRLLGLAALTCLVWGQVMAGPAGFEVVVFDIGHGDAILLRAAQGPVVLVDAGPPGSGSSPAAFTIVPYLRHAGVRAIDVLLLTHAHDDHYGGAMDVLKAFPCRLLMVAAEGDGWPPPQLVDLVLKQGGKVWEAAAGQRLDLGAIRLEVLHPPTGFAGGPNESSLVIRASYGRWSMLLTGDIPAAVERQLLQDYPWQLAADVLKVAHHGSLTSSLPEFLEATGARHAVLSSGGRFGHPSPVVLARLAQAGMTVWRTDRQGAITIRVDARGWEVRGFKTGIGKAPKAVEAMVGHDKAA
ncbi:MAG: DNA internalization-related competence protein ComEC/Rec2 [Bacillota bacterium]